MEGLTKVLPLFLRLAVTPLSATLRWFFLEMISISFFSHCKQTNKHLSFSMQAHCLLRQGPLIVMWFNKAGGQPKREPTVPVAQDFRLLINEKLNGPNFQKWFNFQFLKPTPL